MGDSDQPFGVPDLLAGIKLPIAAPIPLTTWEPPPYVADLLAGIKLPIVAPISLTTWEPPPYVADALAGIKLPIAAPIPLTTWEPPPYVADLLAGIKLPIAAPIPLTTLHLLPGVPDFLARMNALSGGADTLWRSGLWPNTVERVAESTPPCGLSGDHDEIVFVADFKFWLPQLPVPDAVEAPDPAAVFDRSHGVVLRQVEQRLRRLVETLLGQLAGSHWPRQRVPEPVRTRWEDRQAKDREDGRPVYSIIHYADFMDLADVIGRKDNWRDAFAPVFRNLDDLRVSLRRLRPIRDALAHNRPLGRADVLTLFSEACWICRALGVNLFA